MGRKFLYRATRLETVGEITSRGNLSAGSSVFQRFDLLDVRTRCDVVFAAGEFKNKN